MATSNSSISGCAIRLDSMSNPNATTADRLTRLETLFYALVQDVGITKYQNDSPSLVTCLQELQQTVVGKPNFEKTMTDVATLVADLGILKRTVFDNLPREGETSVGNSGSSTSKFRVKIFEPKSYDGTQDANVFNNFVWDVEHYFTAAHISDDEQVSIAAMYLTDNTKPWWCTREADSGRPKITTFKALNEELKEQFMPKNAFW